MQRSRKPNGLIEQEINATIAAKRQDATHMLLIPDYTAVSEKRSDLPLTKAKLTSGRRFALPVSLGRREFCQTWWDSCPLQCEAHVPTNKSCRRYCFEVRRKSHREALSKKMLSVDETGEMKIHEASKNLHLMRIGKKSLIDGKNPYFTSDRHNHDHDWIYKPYVQMIEIGGSLDPRSLEKREIWMRFRCQMVIMKTKTRRAVVTPSERSNPKKNEFEGKSDEFFRISTANSNDNYSGKKLASWTRAKPCGKRDRNYYRMTIESSSGAESPLPSPNDAYIDHWSMDQTVKRAKKCLFASPATGRLDQIAASGQIKRTATATTHRSNKEELESDPLPPLPVQEELDERDVVVVRKDRMLSFGNTSTKRNEKGPPDIATEQNTSVHNQKNNTSPYVGSSPRNDGSNSHDTSEAVLNSPVSNCVKTQITTTRIAAASNGVVPPLDLRTLPERLHAAFLETTQETTIDAHLSSLTPTSTPTSACLPTPVALFSSEKISAARKTESSSQHSPHDATLQNPSLSLKSLSLPFGDCCDSESCDSVRSKQEEMKGSHCSDDINRKKLALGSLDLQEASQPACRIHHVTEKDSNTAHNLSVGQWRNLLLQRRRQQPKQRGGEEDGVREVQLAEPPSRYFDSLLEMIVTRNQHLPDDYHQPWLPSIITAETRVESKFACASVGRSNCH